MLRVTIFLSIIFLWNQVLGSPNLKLYTKVKTRFLEPFRSYSDLAVSQIKIPPRVAFIMFKISAEPFDLSIFGCSPTEVTIFAKHGSYPLLDITNSGFPKEFRQISRARMNILNILTDKREHYLNISSPFTGYYFFTAFFPYTDPRKKRLHPKGFSRHCTGYVNIEAYIEEVSSQYDILSSEKRYRIYSTKNESYYYEYLNTITPSKVTFKIQGYKSSSGDTKLTIRINTHGLPSSQSYFIQENIIVPKDSGGSKSVSYYLNREDTHYVELEFLHENAQTTNSLEFDFIVEDIETKNKMEVTQFELVKETGSESFYAYYNLAKNDFMMPVPLNLSSNGNNVLKFKIEDIIDVGGTLQFSLAFPSERIRKEYKLKNEKDSKYVVIACLAQDKYILPMMPNVCFDDGKKSKSTFILNSDNPNGTVLIPYPESGNWYISMRLFCESCKPCNCTDGCEKKMQECIDKCWGACENSIECTNCPGKCRVDPQLGTCILCDCVNGCEPSKNVCDTSIMYNVHSTPCIKGGCGKNGRCTLLVADGYLFSACSCINNYKGFDCSDGSDATSLWKLILEMLLLIISNFVMIPCCYLAYRRGYYIELVVYASVMIFSIFYHACDAGENIINFCISSPSSLQFGDFFTALFAFYITLVAIADVQDLKLKGVFHVTGAIVLSFCTVVDKTSIWVFMVALLPGILIVIVFWTANYMKYRNFSYVKMIYWQIYLPAGLALAAISLILYVFCETKENYMFIHSLWHILIASSLLLILPKKTTFQRNT